MGAAFANSQTKHIRMRLSQRQLQRFKQDKKDFVCRFITMDETWVYHDPESKQETKEWTEPGTSAPKRIRVQKSAKKVMASVFWDAKGILLVDYLQTGKTINTEYYCNLLHQLDAKIREKRPGLQKKKIFFIRIMHLHTRVFWPWQKSKNCSSNCLNIHPITRFSSLGLLAVPTPQEISSWKNDFHQMKRW